MRRYLVRARAGSVHTALLSHGWSRLPVFAVDDGERSVSFRIRAGASRPLCRMRDVDGGVEVAVEMVDGVGRRPRGWAKTKG